MIVPALYSTSSYKDLTKIFIEKLPMHKPKVLQKTALCSKANLYALYTSVSLDPNSTQWGNKHISKEFSYPTVKTPESGEDLHRRGSLTVNKQ